VKIYLIEKFLLLGMAEKHPSGFENNQIAKKGLRCGALFLYCPGEVCGDNGQ
jgi:hypothetical protein